MATAAASEHEISATRRKLSARIRWARTPLMVAVVGALLTFLAGVVTQELTTSSQDRAKRLELKTTLAADMSKSFTTAVGVARSVGTGTVYSRTGSPVTPDDYAATYNRGLGEWQIGSAALGAELSARFGDQPIVNDWRSYATAVTNFFRVAAVQPPQSKEREGVVTNVRTYVSRVSQQHFDWQVLLETNSRFAGNLRFTQTYRNLSDWLLGRGDQLLEEMLKLQPSV